MAVRQELVTYITSRRDNEGTRVTDSIGSRLGSVQSVNTLDGNKLRAFCTSICTDLVLRRQSFRGRKCTMVGWQFCPKTPSFSTDLFGIR